ncbi:carbohydrate binding domain-containing protein [Candidatus Saccharibacteria bacterium]|nr:carbohydrate binding domain-containing protein [Candidatus Saccharibacteria bacterium]
MLHYVALASLFIAFFTTLFLASTTHAAPGINQTLSFQGRLLNSSGGVVPDGHYNLQFKIYQDGTGTASNNPGGTLKWTETYINNNGTNGVLVKNGLFSVNLGSVTPFGASVDWNQDTIWLSMNVAGSAPACTTYGTTPCAADGEMLPMKRMTATPFAINSAQLGGKTADNFIQLSQGVQEDAASGAASININKTGTGGEFLKLQGNNENMLVINSGGDIQFGNQANHYINIASADADTHGNNIVIVSGTGGSGAGSNGGDTVVLGGEGGGTNGTGGSVFLQGGNGTGNADDGSVYIGTANNATVEIGNSALASGTQTVKIGANNAGGTTNITIGAGSGASGGNTRIQSKENTTIATDGVDRATFDNEGTLTLGNGVSSNTPTDFKIQGTASSAGGVRGGDLTVQGGNATTGNTDGGNLHLSGGTASGTGSAGLVVINTPTYAMASSQTSATSTNVTQANIDSFGVITLDASAPNVSYTLGAPSLGAGAGGRIIYVTAANSSQDFILRANVGAGAGAEQNVPMKQNTTATMVWTGSLWTVAGSASGGGLQSTYNNTVQATGEADIVTSNTPSGNGLVIRDSATNPTSNTVLSVQSSSSAPILSASGATANELASNPGAETAGGSASTFPANTWSNRGIDAGGPGLWDAAVTRHTTAGNNIHSGDASVKVTTENGWTGASNKLTTALTPGVSYNVSLKVRADSTPFSHLSVYLFPIGEEDNDDWVLCTESIAVTSSAWTNVNCTFQAPATVTSQNKIFVTSQDDMGTFYIDDFSVARTTQTANVRVGSGDVGEEDSTLFTLDKSAARPTDGNDPALLGSMYYDTTLGKVQCFEAEGWGDCGTPPDTFITLSPEFAGGIVTGSGTGTMTTDMCSDQLNVNDGSSAQPTVCGVKETYNYYKWTTTSESNQYKVIYVNYQLPQNFKQFISGSTSVMGRTDSTSSTAAYQFYRNDPVDGLIACSVEQPLSNGAQTLWQKGTPGGVADPATCGFEAGDTLVAKIVLGSRSNANSYISNLSFAHSIK